jgi:hypothetical protein
MEPDHQGWAIMYPSNLVSYDADPRNSTLIIDGRYGSSSRGKYLVIHSQLSDLYNLAIKVSQND